MYRFGSYGALLLFVLASTLACSTEAKILVTPSENSAYVEVDIRYQDFFRSYLTDLEAILGPFFDATSIKSELTADPRFINPQVSEQDKHIQLSVWVYPFFETMQELAYIEQVDTNPQSLSVLLHSGLIGALLSEIPSLSVIAQGFTLDEHASPYTLRESLYWALEEYASQDELTRAFDTSDISVRLSSTEALYTVSGALQKEQQGALFQFNPFSFQDSTKQIAVEFSDRQP